MNVQISILKNLNCHFVSHETIPFCYIQVVMVRYHYAIIFVDFFNTTMDCPTIALIVIDEILIVFVDVITFFYH